MPGFGRAFPIENIKIIFTYFLIFWRMVYGIILKRSIKSSMPEKAENAVLKVNVL